MASYGLSGNHDILDMKSGFGAFYHDYDPESFLAAHSSNKHFILHSQVCAAPVTPDAEKLLVNMYVCV